MVVKSFIKEVTGAQFFFYLDYVLGDYSIKQFRSKMSDNFVKLGRYVELKKVLFIYEKACSIQRKFGVYLITCLCADTLFI